MKSVQVMQNRVLKSLYMKDWLTPTNALHRELALLKVSDIFKLKVSQFTFRHRKGLLPGVFNDYFKTNGNVHTYGTRQSRQLHLPRTQTLTGQNTIKVQGVKVFNNLPQDIKSLKSIKTFGERVKKLYISKY